MRAYKATHLKCVASALVALIIKLDLHLVGFDTITRVWNEIKAHAFTLNPHWIKPCRPLNHLLESCEDLPRIELQPLLFNVVAGKMFCLLTVRVVLHQVLHCATTVFQICYNRYKIMLLKNQSVKRKYHLPHSVVVSMVNAALSSLSSIRFWH